MRRLLTLLAFSLVAACSADEFVTPGADAGPDTGVADVNATEGSVPEGGEVDAGVDAGPTGPQLVPGIPAGVDLFGVWGSSTSDFWVVGADSTSQGYAAHWTGSAFASSSNLTTGPLRGVWGNAGAVLVAGDKDNNSNYGAGLYFKAGWTVLPQASILANRNVVSVWFDEVTSEYILQTDGNVMARSPSPNYNTVIDIQGSQIPGNAGPCYAMHARYVACASGVYAPSGQTALFPTNAARAIHVSSTVGPMLFVAGTSGYLARYNNNGFQSVAGAPAQDLGGIWSSATGEVIAVGAKGTILGLNGANPTPTVTVVSSPTKENLHAVTAVGIPANRYMLAVGDKGTVLTWKF